ncbi:hypothetical protein [uncultured Desulfuromusa sp.]|uniref:hypothetical protein n=1 Tax=uncultured Desulfuromusa sp. TaxID=219183 RepID=UPI002AA7312F|nr:hypothetical protein [uncultured Desulfuromusa sp.]
MNRSQISVILLVVLCGAIIYAWVATPRQRRVADGQGPLQQTQLFSQKKKPADFPTVAELNTSGGENRQYQAPKKNLFGPLYLPAPQVKPHPVPASTPAKVTEQVKPPRQIVPVVFQPQPKGPEPIQSLNVLGYLNKAGDYTVFLASKQGQVFLVKAGDVFADDLVVRSISNKEITVGRKQTDQQIVLRLSEAKSQRLPNVKFQSNRPAFVMPKEPDIDKPKPNNGKPEPADTTEAENNKGDQ